MAVNEMALSVLIIAGLCGLIALRILWGQGIGRAIIMLCSFGLLSVAAGGIVGGLDLLTYHKSDAGLEVATVKFEKTGARQFRVTVVDSAGDSYLRQIEGEQWQLAARVIKPGGVIPGQLGIGPVYRLDKLSALSTGAAGDAMTDESYPSSPDKGVVDLWLWLTEKPQQRLLSASYVSTGYAPMLDAQVFVVRLEADGLVARM